MAVYRGNLLSQGALSHPHSPDEWRELGLTEKEFVCRGTLGRGLGCTDGVFSLEGGQLPNC